VAGGEGRRGFGEAIFRPNPEVRAQAGAVQGPSTTQVPHKPSKSTAQVRIVLEAGRETRTRGELQSAVGLTHRQHFIKEYLNPLLKAGLIEMTIPDKPRSSKQRYRTTATGVEALGAEKKEP
jgi:ATP-dependent DNA helicase RecG